MMRYPALFFRRMLPTALALGTAWAARGQIGHEYGAAWAGSIGVLVIIALSGRQDWYNRLPVIVALGAIAWGFGGVISYGKVVGYGHAGDYLNVSYGLVMLMLIGALYGFIGGGITGLALESTSEKKVDWAALITQMFAGGFLCWGLFIYELEWLMTPPRSELWAACLGSAIALGWYLYRNGYAYALHTAFFSALGAGFGFGFGNFLQRMGQTAGIDFNWWNVMEYSIGFFGGLGMAYGIFSRNNWPKTIDADKVSNTIGWIFLILLLPVLNLIEAAGTKTMLDTGQRISPADPATFAVTRQVIMWVMSFAFMIVLSYFFRPSIKKINTQGKTIAFTLLLLTWYILISNFISATWLTPKFSSQHLYWVNLVVLFFLLRNNITYQHTEPFTTDKPYAVVLLKWWAVALLIILFISYIAITFGNVRPNAQLRFE